MEVTRALLLRTCIFVFSLTVCLLVGGTALSQEQHGSQPKTILEPSDAFLSSAVARPLPVYPREVGASGLSGSVLTEIHVGEEGYVIYARSRSAVSVLAAFATEAVRAWRWEPVTESGSKVRVIGMVQFLFGPDGSVRALPTAEPVPADAVMVSPGTLSFFKEQGALLTSLPQAPEFSIRGDDSISSPIIIDSTKLRAMKREVDG